MTGRPASSSFRWVWFLIAGIVIAVAASTVGLVIYSVNRATDGISSLTTIPSPGGTFVPSPGGPTIVIPSFPSVQPDGPSEPSGATVPPGGQRTAGQGVPVGRVYRLDDGRLIYVLPSGTGAAPTGAAPSPSAPHS